MILLSHFPSRHCVTRLACPCERVGRSVVGQLVLLDATCFCGTTLFYQMVDSGRPSTASFVETAPPGRRLLQESVA